MVSIRFTSLVLGLLLTFVSLRDSIAQAHQVAATTANGNVPTAAGAAVTSINQELLDNAATTDGARRLKGRKMVMNDDMMKEGNVNGGPSKITSTNIHHEKKGKPSVECKLSETNVLPKKVSVVGLGPFNADYNVPRPHPPKNN
ncbi:uncharacterized protein LOC131257375 isoform X2 [Magnolia sinica]|uniref:uncharacterized protein LOC131257375 isoform X2 n=1 Tax=Magnolia sinica TaxID=86752 RepID=UPI002658FA79|nr:uncharacterized protein LOC131257375 isoform X2 [Magnolia sinica]